MEISTVYLPEHLERLIDNIAHKYCDVMFSLQMLEDSTNISKTKIYEIMKINFGLPPWSFVEKLRLNKAILYFKDSEFPITQVGYKVGYYNSKTFRNMTKKYMNVSPKELIKYISSFDDLNDILVPLWLNYDTKESEILAFYLYERILPQIYLERN